MSTTTITRDVRALAQRPPLPVLCPTCGLPSRLDVDPSAVTDDPDELAAVEQAMARLFGSLQDEQTPPRRRPVAHPSRPEQAVTARVPCPEG